jgi:hypothetical protein
MLLSLLPTPKGFKKMLAMLLAHALGSPGIVAAGKKERAGRKRRKHYCTECRCSGCCCCCYQHHCCCRCTAVLLAC